MAERLRIRDFEKTFLTDKTRGRKGRLKFLQLPVKLDDLDYKRIASGKNGAIALGVWMALLELAGTLESRDGVLARRDGRPMDLDDLAMMTSLDVRSVEIGIEALKSDGWLISEQFGTIPNDSERPPLEGRGVERSREEGSKPPQTPQGGDVDLVVAHYQTHHPRAKPGDKERRLIRARMKEGYSVDDLKRAIDGNHLSPHHCGENDRRTKYHGLHLIFRDSDHVNSFIEHADGNGQVGSQQGIHEARDRQNKESAEKRAAYYERLEGS